MRQLTAEEITIVRQLRAEANKHYNNAIYYGERRQAEAVKAGEISKSASYRINAECNCKYYADKMRASYSAWEAIEQAIQVSFANTNYILYLIDTPAGVSV